MATHKSAEKRNRQNEKRRIRNTSIKTYVKTRIKEVLKTVENKDIEGAKSALAKVIPVIDKASTKGVLHKNTASRKISRLARKVNSLSISKS
ncbi:MAG: 30S ribosomal protein S20 [Thermodesulfobacteriota bacterium]|nr:30S ribosomal protein S20 [Thermodesulfobacteriota bacterium]